MARDSSNIRDGDIEPRVVRIEAGLLEGRAREGVWEFIGIPYAKPPLGELRWRPPRPVKPWDGVRPCAQFGESCPQPEAPIYQLGESGEDCLYLNIWAPKGGEKEKLPVMVWIHGGAFLSGSASIQMRPGLRLYDGRRLAERGAIVITINYRLGPFGFLAHPLLSRESPRHVSGNYGLLDQIAALRWIAKNIEAFGGDASRVTLFGQSAGAVSICFLMVSPLARGLFQRAISESAPLWIKLGLPPAHQDLHAAERTGEELAHALGYGDSEDTIRMIRHCSEDDIIQAAGLKMGLVPEGMDFGPVVDGWVLPESPEALFAKSRRHEIDLIVGWNRHESDYFMNLYEVTLRGYESYVRQMAGPYADEVLERFPADEESVGEVFPRLINTFEFEAPARFMGRCIREAARNAFLYLFTRVPPGPQGQSLCACHGMEIPYVFGDVEDEGYYDRLDDLLSHHIMDYFTNFARGGDPNAPGLPPWPNYERATDSALELGDEIAIRALPDPEACDLAQRIHLGVISP